VEVGLRRLPLQSALFHHRDLARRLRQLAPEADLAILQLVRLAAYVDDLGSTPFVVDLIDSLSLNLSRRAQLDRLWWRPLLRLEARLLGSWERRVLLQAVGGLVVCERDRQALASGRREDADLASRVAVVPIAFEAPETPPMAPPPGARPTLALTGNLGYFVNHDAAIWFLAEVWPQLRQSAPELRLLVAGDRPSASLRRRIAAAGAELAESPPDLRAQLTAATVALAPMRGGSGQPLKILEAWAAGVPVVASPWAAAGTTATPGVDLLVAERPADWVRAIVAVMGDPVLRSRLVAAGRARLRSSYSPAEVGRRFLATLPPPATTVAGASRDATAG
jgi:glycosyltransferase involved in cell wall biosynthesis